MRALPLLAILLLLASAHASEPGSNFIVYYDLFSDGAVYWRASGPGTLEHVRDVESHTGSARMQASGPGFVVVSSHYFGARALSMRFHAMPNASDDALIEILRAADPREQASARIRLADDGIHAQEGASWVKLGQIEGWHTLDLALAEGTISITLDQGAPVLVPDLAPQPATRLSQFRVLPGDRAVTFEQVIGARYPVTSTHTFTSPPEARGMRVVEAGGAEIRLMPTSPGFVSPGRLDARASGDAGTLAYVAADTSERPLSLVTSAIRFPDAFAAAQADHPALLAALDADGGVVWALTYGPPVGLGGSSADHGWGGTWGFWFWGDSPAPVPLGVVGIGVPWPELDFGWRPVHAWIDNERHEVRIWLDDETNVLLHFHVEGPERIVAFASGDVWSGTFPSGAGEMQIDELAVWPRAW